LRKKYRFTNSLQPKYYETASCFIVRFSDHLRDKANTQKEEALLFFQYLSKG